METGPTNYTIAGKTDGFGCQYNAVLSGFSFCEHSTKYNYIHTPFYGISHGWGWMPGEPIKSWRKRTKELDDFIGIPDNREGRKIHTSQRFNSTVFNDPRPSNWYDSKTLEKIKGYYWSTPKPSPCKQDIVVHIRRGDNQPSNRQTLSFKTYTVNEWYRDRIPWIASMYPDDYTIAIHSEGEMSEFESIMDGWPRSLIDRTTWKLAKNWLAYQEFDLKTAFHEMVTTKVLLQSRSGFSYVAGLLSEGDVFFYKGNRFSGQKYPLDHWKAFGSEYEI